MLRKFKITYTKGENAKRYEEELLASSKYNAKKTFCFRFPGCEIVKVEEVRE